MVVSQLVVSEAESNQTMGNIVKLFWQGVYYIF